MSYLSQPTSKTEFGVAQVGDYILVQDGVISLSQDLAPNATVTFANVNVTDLLVAEGNVVLTSVTPEAGSGITLSNVYTGGYDAGFKITNSGVLSLTAGPGISLTGNVGNITVSATGADLINVYGTTTNYTATYNDEYIGVNSTTSVIIALPLGVDGRVYYIKDERGQGSGKITIQPQAGESIDNSTAYIISVPYQCVGVVFRAGQWRII